MSKSQAKKVRSARLLTETPAYRLSIGTHRGLPWANASGNPLPRLTSVNKFKQLRLVPVHNFHMYNKLNYAFIYLDMAFRNRNACSRICL